MNINPWKVILILITALTVNLTFAQNLNSWDQQDFNESELYLSAEEKSQKLELGYIQENQLEMDYRNFKLLMPELLAFRLDALHLFKSLQKKAKEKRPLSGRDLKILHDQFSKRLKLRKELSDILNRNLAYLRSFYMDEETRLKGVLLYLATFSQVVDNHNEVLVLFAGQDNVRRSLNERNPSYSRERELLYKELKSFNAFSNLFKKIHALRIFERRKDYIRDYLSYNHQLTFLADIIEDSQTYKTYTKHTSGRIFREIFRNLTNRLWLSKLRRKDLFHYSVRKVTGFFSKIFGNAVGSVQLRKGKLIDRDDVIKDIAKNLRPFDILLEKTPFRLTDHLIPGHFGHAAIWIGTQSDLIELDLWDHPLIIPHQQAIKNGRSIVEALRPGVQINTLKHFMDIDDFALMRKKELTLEEIKEGILITVSQIGKDYDFNFDVETQQSLVCSELIYLAYPDYDWRTHRTLGRFDILPDDVARETLFDRGFETLLFYHDGEKSQGPKALMTELLKESEKGLNPGVLSHLR